MHNIYVTKHTMDLKELLVKHSFPQTVIRFVVAPLSAMSVGLGYLWVLFGTHQSWHDKLSGTVMYYLPPEW